MRIRKPVPPRLSLTPDLRERIRAVEDGGLPADPDTLAALTPTLDALTDDILRENPEPVERDEDGNKLSPLALTLRQMRRKRESEALCGDKRGVARMEQSWAKTYRREAA